MSMPEAVEGPGSTFVEKFHMANHLNRQVSEQNRALRRKAFSFTKPAIHKRDICQIAKNLDELNKATRGEPPKR